MVHGHLSTGVGVEVSPKLTPFPYKGEPTTNHDVPESFSERTEISYYFPDLLYDS